MSCSEAAASLDHPFVGLRPFSYHDHAFFFGRQAEIDTLEPLVRRHRFVAVVGSSGSGKSSLVRAGLLPRIDHAATSTLDRWRWTEMRPGEAPVRRLARALSQLESSDDHLGEAWTDRIEMLLRRSSFGLCDAARLLSGSTGHGVIILIDQFEEIFRFSGLKTERPVDIATARENREEATAFIRLLLVAANSQETKIRIIITMRSDFIGECAQFHGLPEAVTASQFLVPGLTRDQRAAAICGPIERAGGAVDPGLVQRALNDTNEDPDQLPVLQHAMMRCWQRAVARCRRQSASAPEPTLNDYEKIGGVQEALSIHANEILREIASTPVARFGSGGVELVTKRIFQALTEADPEGRVTRRPQRFGDLVSVLLPEAADASMVDGIEHAARLVVERFADPDCSFLRAPRGGDLTPECIVDIGHEALIRRWDRLKGKGRTDWVREEHEDGDRYRDLVRAARADSVIPEEELPSVLRWWSQRRPNRFWARRYTRDNADYFDDVTKLLKKSQERVEQETKRRQDFERAERKAVEARLRAEALEAHARAEAIEASARNEEIRLQAVAAQARARAMEEADIRRRQRTKYQWTFLLSATAVLLIATMSYFLATNRLAEARRQAEYESRQKEAAEQRSNEAVARENAFKARVLSLIADAVLSPRPPVGAGDALAIAVTKPDDLPNVWEYQKVLYRGLGELREKRRIVDLAAQPFGVGFVPEKGLITAVLPGAEPQLLFIRQQDGGVVDSVPLSGIRLAWSARWDPRGERVFIGSNPTSIVLTPCSREKLRPYFSSCRGQDVDRRLVLGSPAEPAGPGFWSPDGQWILTGGFQAPAKLWNAESGQVERRPISDWPATAVAFSADQRRIAVGSPDGRIFILETENWTIDAILRQEQVERAMVPFSLAFNPANSDVLLSTAQNAMGRLWTISSGAAVELKHDRGNVYQGAFNPNGEFIVTAAEDGLVRLWDLDDALGPAVALRGHRGSVFSIDVAADGTIISGSSDRSIRLWSRTTPLSPAQSKIMTQPLDEDQMRSLARSDRRKLPSEIASSVRLPDGFGAVADAAVSADGQTVAIAATEGHILIYAAMYPKRPIASLGEPQSRWKSVSFSEDGRSLVGVTEAGVASVWPHYSTVELLQQTIKENLPLQGSVHISYPADILCELTGEDADECKNDSADRAR